MKSPALAWPRLTLVAIAASAVGFAIHVAAQSIVPPWVARQMQGVPSHTTHSPSELVAAALTSIEIGAALCALYILLRKATPSLGPIRRGLLLGLLALAIHGELIRQPLMNAIIGNPLRVVLAMAAGPWLGSFVMCIVLAAMHEWLIPRQAGSTQQRSSSPTH